MKIFRKVKNNTFKLISEGEFLRGPFFDDEEEKPHPNIQFLDKADIMKKIENQPPADGYEIGKDLAIKLINIKWWLNKKPEEIALVQLYIEEVCMDFSTFHKALEQALGQSIHIHQLVYEMAAFQDRIVRKYFGGKKPTLKDLMKIILS